MAKSGLCQLDGTSAWDISALGKLLAMLFDEWAIFGGPLEDAQDMKATTSPTKSPPSRPAILSNRSKTAGKGTLSSRPNIVERYSSEDSPKLRPQKKFDVDAMLKTSVTPKPADVSTNNDTTSGTDSLTSRESGFKVDSKGDFMSALTATLDDNPDTSTQESTSRNAESLFKSTALGPAANRRRWMTLPTNALATIQESDDVDDSRGGDREPQRTFSLKGDDSTDGEMVLHPGEKKKSRQMRVPHVKPNENAELLSSFLDSVIPPTKKEDDTKKEQDKEVNDSPPLIDKQRSLPTEGDIESAGTAFLDAISKSMGFGNE